MKNKLMELTERLEKKLDTPQKANDFMLNLFYTMPIENLHDGIVSMEKRYLKKMTKSRQELLDTAKKIYSERIAK